MNVGNVFLVFVVVFIIILVLTTRRNHIPVLEGKSVSEILAQIPKNDRENLEYFFRTNIAWDQFGYVVFGEKPMAFEGYQTTIHPFENLSEFLYAISPRRIKYERGVKAWKKYQRLFPMTRFAFFWEETPAELTYFLVNKTSFVQAVEQYNTDFKNIFNRKITGIEILQDAAHRPLLSVVLFGHEGLIGTLLGFGRDNAFLFHQRSQLKSEKEIENFDRAFNFGDPWKKEMGDFEKKMEAVGWVSAFITGDHLKNFELNPLPGFLAILDHPETVRLKKHYLQTREKMIKFYKDKDFLEATLKLLTS